MRNFPHKYLFIDFNGGVCRAIGRRMCNSRLLYNGGLLGFMYECDGSSPAPFIESTASFASRVRELGLPFLYVQIPAKSRVKVLVVKDSFANPVVGFLSTVCREIVKVDPRRCTSGEEIFQLVAKHRPDIVVMLVNPTALRNEKFMLTPAIHAPVPKGTMSR